MAIRPQLDIGVKYPDRMLIGGEWVASSSAGVFTVVDPATEEVLAQVARAEAVDVDRAVAAARRAFDEGPWPRLSHAERAGVLRRIGAGLRERADELGHLWTRQTGVLHKRASASPAGVAAQFDATADLAATFPFEETFPGSAGGTGRLVREPVGVVGAIVPWNGPLILAALKMAPALLAGCTMVLKASPEAPLELYVLAEVAEAAGVPPGVINLIVAERDASERLVVHPDVDKISFTGSTAAGRRIAALCGDRIARCTLELGGKSPAVILDDAQIDETAQTLFDASLRLSGQVCAALTRVIVSERLHDDLVDALGDRFRAARAGDPYDPESDLGPLAMERQRNRVESYISKGRDEGASLVAGGNRPDLAKGFYVEPTLFAKVDNSWTIAREEIFGPVLSVIPTSDEAESVRVANDTPFGLNASVFTADSARADAVARQIRSGTVAWNRFGVDFAGAFGGFKQSGIGREGGREGLLPYLETKTILI